MREEGVTGVQESYRNYFLISVILSVVMGVCATTGFQSDCSLPKNLKIWGNSYSQIKLIALLISNTHPYTT